MRSRASQVAWLLPCLLTGCFQTPFFKKHTPPAVLAPRIQASQTLEVVDIPLPAADTVIAGLPIYNMREQPEPIRPPRHKRANPSDDAANPPEQPADAEVSALGTLSSGDPANLREQTENSIADIERRLNNLSLSSSDPEQKTADHIREFLKQAHAALDSGDVEGAHTLAGKAEVLLAELTK